MKTYTDLQQLQTPEIYKTCVACDHDLPISCFYWDKSNGYRNTCKDCCKESSTRSYYRRKQDVIEKVAKQLDMTPAQVKAVRDLLQEYR